MRHRILAVIGLHCALVSPAPAQDLYDIDTYRTFYLTFTQTNWWSQLTANVRAKTDIKADLRIGSTLYRDIGIRFRGSSSYAATGSSQKKSFNITTDAFVPGLEVLGYDSLNLSNGFNDPTFTREVVSYEILRRYMPAPKANYIKLYINNEYWGVYVNVQQPDKGMIREWFKGNDGNRYRCDPPTFAGRGRSALQWLGTNLQSYRDAYELKTPTNTTSFVDLMNLCNVLNNTPSAQLPTQLPRVLNVDRVLWYFAANNILVNLDCYIGRGNDYYLYHDQQHDTFEIMPWDMNESFGGYNASMSVAQLEVLPTDWQASNRTSRPLMYHVLANWTWRERYYAHYRTLVDEIFDWQKLGTRTAQLQSKIAADVAADTKKLYSTSQFSENLTKDLRLNTSFFRTWVPGLEPFIKARRSYLLGVRELAQITPTLSALAHTPARPKASDPVVVTARVAANANVRDASLYWRVRGPFVRAPMFDDGQHGDGAASDGVFGAIVAPQAAGSIVDYYVSAGALGGGVKFLPRTAAHRAPSWRVVWPTKDAAIKLNEFVARNNSGAKDEKGQFEDWVELFNSDSQAFDVSGMYLTDDETKPTRWKIPANTTVGAGGTLLVWLDDDAADGPLHANFKLAADGEEIAIFDTDGRTRLDFVEFGRQQADVSTGRLFDGVSPWVTYSLPTPLARNAPLSCGTRDYSALDPITHGISHSVTGKPSIASTVTVSLENGVSNGAFVELLAGSGLSVRIPTTRITLLVGSPIFFNLVVPADAAGAASLPLLIPDDVALIGARVYFQAISIDATGLSASNATEVTICPK